jgi:gliding motility-associated-like protein
MDEPTEITPNFEIKNISCNGKNDGELKIQTTGGTPFYQYNFNQNGFKNTNNFIGLDVGSYEIITKDANGCQVIDTTEIIEPQAIAVDLGDDILTEIGNQVEVNATVTNGISPFVYHWNPADSLISCDDCLDAIITTNEAIKRYDFIVTDANGCLGEDFIIIRTNKNQTIFVASAFTPNDDGNNDVLFVQGSENIEKSTFQVFDRWGELVFETKNTPINDENFGWNGTLGNQKMNSGIFVWVAEVTFEDGSVEILRGSTFLMR